MVGPSDVIHGHGTPDSRSRIDSGPTRHVHARRVTRPRPHGVAGDARPGLVIVRSGAPWERGASRRGS
jgi:hypothetical protein